MRKSKWHIILIVVAVFVAACSPPKLPSPTPEPSASPSATATQTPTRIFPSAIPQVFATATALSKSQTPDMTKLATFIFGIASAIPSRTPSPIATPVILPKTPTPTLSGVDLIDFTPTVEPEPDCLLRGKVSAERGLNIRASNDAKSELLDTLSFGESLWYYRHRPTDANSGWSWVRVVERLPFEFHFILAPVGWVAGEFIEVVGECR